MEFYSQIRLVHICAVVASGSRFLVRGLLVQAGVQLAMAAAVRYLSYAIDTILLIAGATLFFILPTSVFSNGWLSAKLLLLAVYIALGTMALRRGRTAGVRRVCFVLAVAVFACMFAIARTHHPLGPIKLLGGIAVMTG